jgi:hypothetical protein
MISTTVILSSLCGILNYDNCRIRTTGYEGFVCAKFGWLSYQCERLTLEINREEDI